MSIVPHRTYSLADSPPEYRKALHRVAGQPSALTNVARWLLEFTFRETAGLSQNDWKELQWEGAAFFYREEYLQQKPPPKAATKGRQKVVAALVVQKYPWMRGYEIDPLPPKTNLIELQDWLRSLWDGLEKDGAVWITSSGWVARLFIKKNRTLVGLASPQASSWLERFKFRTYEILTATEVGKRIRFCKSEKCRRPFLSVKRQAFCSASCSQRHRTVLYRTKNREQFRIKRREYYAKKQREQTGLPNLRIQTRKGVRA
ncbi:MAG: hypothetical protein ACRD2L_15830 [Terriglobia bacterium]